MSRHCAGRNGEGLPCRAAPLTDAPFCLMHDPAHADAVAEGRRLGGLRRRRVVVLRATYELGDLDTLEGLRRLRDVAVEEVLALEASPARSRGIDRSLRTALDLHRVSVIEARLRSLESRFVAQRGSGLRHEGLLGDLPRPDEQDADPEWGEETERVASPPVDDPVDPGAGARAAEGHDRDDVLKDGSR